MPGLAPAIITMRRAMRLCRFHFSMEAARQMTPISSSVVSLQYSAATWTVATRGPQLQADPQTTLMNSVDASAERSDEQEEPRRFLFAVGFVLRRRLGPNTHRAGRDGKTPGPQSRLADHNI
ncbi:hypothetical protein EYF80_054033 [Liparis tanakae]|uniref:Uncharacterized protein n=1 Tax=Liparis tanakae TaxID=230148 RepID=A0A4Z2F410_9TELE|nr:hypothetical protein EYF80_054033 [Liparis tanakae]